MYLPEQLIELAAASNDVRYYLQGVYYDAPEKRWIATNGHMLVCLPAECGEGETFPSCSGIVPIEAFTLARKVGKSRLGKNLRIPCELVEIEGKPQPQFQSLGLAFDCIDGKFPDVSRAIPEKKEKPDLGLNHEYLAIIGKILCNGSKKRFVSLELASDSPADRAFRVTGMGEGFAVLMPARI